jgi:UDP-3-O-[3-hydroxymyristoyl] N-acetylglucosamine deacetylase
MAPLAQRLRLEAGMPVQRTLRRPISCAGVGLHSGHKVNLTLKPAPAGFGIRFRRTDLGNLEVPATVHHLLGIQLATNLARNQVSIETVEHLLAALVSVGVDNAIVELNSPEVPIMDGSASPFLYLIEEAGLRTLPEPRKYLKVVSPVRLTRGDKSITLEPADHFEITYSISYDHPLLRHQARTLRVTRETFADEIAPARTFTFLKDVDHMRQNGLALGGTLDNAVVLGDHGVINGGALRFDDEFVRHKMLDAIGDLALLGYPVIGHLVAHRAGHALHTEFVARVLEEKGAWRLIEAPVNGEAPALTIAVARGDTGSPVERSLEAKERA